MINYYTARFKSITEKARDPMDVVSKPKDMCV